MSDTVIRVEDLSKQYRLGLVGTSTLTEDLARWWARFRGREDPTLLVTEANVRGERGTSEYVWALRDVNFEVNRGEVLGIIGKNGAGKSTLLKILSRVTAPTSGCVKMKGRVGSLLEVGTGFHGELTGRENIYLNGAILGMSRREIASRLHEIVDFSGCERYIDTPVKRYSSGMIVRLGFAVAAHLEPEILMVDEVLAVGDFEFQKKCLGKMKDVAGEGRTVLFVSHNMASIKHLCGKGLVLAEGRLVLSDVADVAIEEYLSIRETRPDDGQGKLSKYISRIRLTNSEGEDCSAFATGAPITLTVDYSMGDKIVEKPVFGIAVKDPLGTKVFTVGSFLSPSEMPPSLTGDFTAVCHVPEQNLAPGDYSIFLALGDATGDLDIVDDAGTLSIAPTDYYGTGKLPIRSQGKVLIRSTWRIRT